VASFAAAQVEEEDGFQELRFAEDFWTIAKGSEIHRAEQIETNVVYARTRKA